MSRTKGFDVERAVLAAREVFWRQGFEATSVADLVAATGVGRQSLYDTFGDKAGLYERALSGYCEDQLGQLAVTLVGDGPVLDRVRMLFEGTVLSALCDPERRGCFVVNAGAEAAGPETSRAVSMQIGRLGEAFTAALTTARARGELSADADVAVLGRFLVTTLVGLQSLARAHPDPDLLRDSVAIALQTLQARH